VEYYREKAFENRGYYLQLKEIKKQEKGEKYTFRSFILVLFTKYYFLVHPKTCHEGPEQE
jgi:hypothetical protein